MSTFKDKPLKKCHTDKRKMIDDIHNNITDDLSAAGKIEYYLNNGIILDQYYSKDGDNLKKIDKCGILNYFNKEEGGEKEEKKDLINEYMSNIDDTILKSEYNDYKIDKCKYCNLPFRLDMIEGYLMCEKCGNTEDTIIITDKSSYNDPPREISYFAYKRINHFNEWLAQFQAKETTEIPDTIYKDIYNELKKNMNLDLNHINYKQIREILKKLKYNKYYEHIPHIINIISGKKAPCLTRESEERLRSLFKEIQIPFIRNCPSSRKNFLSYSYVLHKFCELLEYDHLIDFFPLLKSREKLQQQDKIWESICKDLKWEYIPST